MTTFVTARIPGWQRKTFAQGELREPELADDLGRGQVAAEALMPGGAEAAAHRTAGLRGNAQRAAIGFRDEDGFDGVTPPTSNSHLTVPSAATLSLSNFGRRRPHAAAAAHAMTRRDPTWRRSRQRPFGESSERPASPESASRPDLHRKAASPSRSNSSRLTMLIGRSRSHRQRL
jgi:hypothetical protein